MVGTIGGGNRFSALTDEDRVDFSEPGSATIHRGHSLHLFHENVHFETTYAVAPGARLQVWVAPASGCETHELPVEVVSVDTRPGNRFRVAGRLSRDR